MEESSTYQYILARGEALGIARGVAEGKAQGVAEGKAQEARAMLLLIGTQRLGAPQPQTQSKIENITSSERLEQLATRLLQVETWEELLA